MSSGRPYMDNTIQTEPRSPVSVSHERRNRDFDEWGGPLQHGPTPAIARRNTLLAMMCFPPLWPFVAMVVAGGIISHTMGDNDAHQ